MTAEFFLIALAALAHFTQAHPTVLVRPAENETLPVGAPGIIVAGHVAAGEPWVWINGVKTEVFRTGSFAAYLAANNLAEHGWTVAAWAGANAPRARKKVKRESSKPLSLQERILSSVEPKTSLVEIPTGESLNISFEAAPGSQAWYKIASVTDKIHMNESRPGFYENRFTLPPQESYKQSQGGELSLFIENKESLQIDTKKMIRVSKAGTWPKAFKAAAENTRILSSPQPGSYWFSAALGTALTADAVFGPLRRLRLGGALKGWAMAEEIAPEKYLPAVATIQSIQVLENASPASETVIKIQWNSNAQLPFLVEENDQELKIRIFSARIHLNWIPFKNHQESSFVEGISWDIPMEDEVAIHVELSRPLSWGYWTESFKGGLSLRLRSPTAPPANPSKTAASRQIISPYQSRLSGLKIVIDPGHGGKETGALSPSGRSEQEANLGLAKILQGKLESRGAKVQLTRRELEQNQSLQERVAAAKAFNADFFLSLHCNDFASPVNPFEGGPWGYSIYYHHRLSLALAHQVRKSLEARDLAIPSNGVLWGDLYVLRELTIPAVLIETGYLILPWQEELIFWNKKFADQFTESLAGALEIYAKEASQRRKR